MVPTRNIRWIVATLALVGSGIACSPAGSDSPGSGGAQSTGGHTSTGGASASGGSSATGGSSGTGGATASGGNAQPGSGGMNTNTGGSGTPASGGRAGGSSPGGAAAGTGGRAGGSTGQAGAGNAGSAGATGAGGAAGASKSDGCAKTRTLQNGTRTITVGGASRTYILRTPDNYDNAHAYRLVVAYAESGASAMSVASGNYFKMASLDTGKTSIFVAPEAVGGSGQWSKSDVDFTDAILAQVEGDLCIDKSRIFATGFSFGGGMAIAVACTRADVFRGVAFFSGADLTGSCTGTLTKPIAYYATQASEDSSGTPMPSSGKIKQADFAKVNGCTAEPNALDFPAAGQPHTCTIYKNCSEGHPTVYCIFNGPHGWEPKDPGQSTSWAAPDAWKFITQF